MSNKGGLQTPRMKKSHMLFNNIVTPSPSFIHVPVGKVGDYPIGTNGEEAKPEKLLADSHNQVGIKERLKLMKLKAHNEDVSPTKA